MTKVPAQYQGMVDAAAAALGIPASVVAAQISYESGFQPGVVSSAGAQGIAQFEPGTFRAYGHGSPFNPSDAFAAYTAYMKSLLGDFHGDLRKALAAYNAGPGNYSAGLHYADHVLSAAGTGDITVGDPSAPGLGGAVGGGAPGLGGAVGGGASTAGVMQAIIDLFSSGGHTTQGQVDTIIGGNLPDPIKAVLSTLAGIQSWLGGLVSALQTLVSGALWLINPANWVRIAAAVIGTVSLVAGAVLIGRSA